MASVPSFFFFNDPAPTEIYTLSLHDALPISEDGRAFPDPGAFGAFLERPNHWLATLGLNRDHLRRSEEHTSELQSHSDLVCRLLLEKKKPHTPARTLRPAQLTYAQRARAHLR